MVLSFCFCPLMSSAVIIALFAQMSAVILLIPLVVSWSVSNWGKSYLLAPQQKAFCQPYTNSGGNFKVPNCKNSRGTVL